MLVIDAILLMKIVFVKKVLVFQKLYFATLSHTFNLGPSQTGYVKK